jgi:hypothetical protein
MKAIVAHNPNGLPVIDFRQLVDFQGDFKHPISPAALEKIKASLIKHGLFVPKFVWFDPQGAACIIDGHQTHQALESLEADGYQIPPVPYVRVVAADRAEAAEKLLQLNSRYGQINPDAQWLHGLPDIETLLPAIEIPELIGFDVQSEPSQDADDGDEDGPVEENIYPIHRIHVLLSFDTEKYPDLLPLLIPLQDLADVEYRQSGN